MSLGVAITAGASYALMPRFGRKVLQAGLLIVAAALVWLAVTVTHDGLGVSSWELVPALLAFGLGMGFVFGPLFNVILAGVEEHEVGSASGTLNAIQQLGNSIGVAVLATIFFSLLDHGHAAADGHDAHGADLGRPCSSPPSRCPSCSPRTRGWRSSSPAALATSGPPRPGRLGARRSSGRFGSSQSSWRPSAVMSR